MKLRLRRVLVLKSCYKIWVDLLRRHCRRCEEANDINISRRTPPQQFTVFQKTSNHPLETGRESKRPECCPETEPSAQNRASFRGSSKLCTNFRSDAQSSKKLPTTHWKPVANPSDRSAVLRPSHPRRIVRLSGEVPSFAQISSDTAGYGDN